MAYVCAIYSILFFASASIALHRALTCFIVVPFSDFQPRSIFYTISMYVKFNYQLCDCNIFYSILHKCLTHINYHKFPEYLSPLNTVTWQQLSVNFCQFWRKPWPLHVVGYHVPEFPHPVITVLLYFPIQGYPWSAGMNTMWDGAWPSCSCCSLSSITS